jgi:hypothetical protein
MASRGFLTEWRPYAKSRALLDQVNAVLAEYAAQLPLTLRQMFYILVGRWTYEKIEQAYDRLGNLLTNARRGGLISMDALRDDGFIAHESQYWRSVDEFMLGVRAAAADFRLDRQDGQSRRLFVWCEAAGMVPQLARIADPYGIAVLASGGFDSLTDKHRLAREWASRTQPTRVLHVGDFDPSGVCLFDVLAEDIGAFAEYYGGDIDFVRIAVTREQARPYNLTSAPPKPTDNRRRHFGGEATYQAEALDPRTLAAIVLDAIESRLDRGLYEQVLADEEEMRQAALSALDRIGGAK